MMEARKRKRQRARRDRGETIPLTVLRMENGREVCWILRKLCFWDGEFETVVLGWVLLCVYASGWTSANDCY